MILSVILAMIIGAYMLWVIRRKIQDVKEGRYCGGSCEGCQRNCTSCIQK